MDLIKAINDKDYNSIKEYCAEKVSTIITDKITTAQKDFLDKRRGVTSESKKTEDGKLDKEDGDEDKAKDPDDKEKYVATT